MEGATVRCNRVFPLIAAGLLSVLALVFASSSFAANRVAMVVGNSAYAADARLENPDNDAQALADVLRSMDFDDVVLATDVTRVEFESALDTFHDLAKNADVAVFFYAGHAIQWQGGNYMIPVDVQLESERDIKRLILLDDVVKDASASRDLGLVILDACRDNPFLAQLSDQGTRGFQRGGLASPPGAAGTLVAFATQADAVAYDGTGNHSPYTSALIKHLPTANKDISLVFRAVRDEVAAATDWQQQPFTYGSLGGDEIWLVTDDSVQPGATGQALVVKPQPESPPDGMAFFSVDANPSDARVRILKPEMAYAPGMVLPLGRQYDIMVSRKGYKASRQSVEISEPIVRLEVALDQLNRGTTSVASQTSSASSADVSALQVGVTVEEQVSGAQPTTNDTLTLRTIKSLNDLGVNAMAVDALQTNVQLSVALSYAVTFDRQYSSYNADCLATYQLINSEDGRLLTSRQTSVDPAGGFTIGEVTSDCARRLLGSTTSKIVDEIRNQARQEGLQASTSRLTVAVKNTQGSRVTSLIDAVNGMPGVSFATADGFRNGTLIFLVDYQGEAFAFADAMISLGTQQGLTLQLEEVNENSLELAAN